MQNDLIDKIPDVEFLTWIRDRLVYVYGESPHVDFVRRLETIIEAKQPEQGTGEGSICVQDNPLVSPVGNDGVPSPGLVLAADVMREALEFYGDRKNHMGSLARAMSAIELDNEGDIARQALAKADSIKAQAEAIKRVLRATVKHFCQEEKDCLCLSEFSDGDICDKCLSELQEISDSAHTLPKSVIDEVMK